MTATNGRVPGGSRLPGRQTLGEAIMRTSKPHTYRHALRAILAGAACGSIALAALMPGVAHAAPEGRLKSMSLNLVAPYAAPSAVGPTGGLVVVSDDGETWNRFLDAPVALGGTVNIEMKTGRIKNFGIFWGACSGHDCFSGSPFAVPATPLLVSTAPANAYTKKISMTVNFTFPASIIPTNLPGPGISFGDQIIARCNAALEEGKSINEGHEFTFVQPVTLGTDTMMYTGANFNSAGEGSYTFSPPNPMNDVDFSKTSQVVLPVTCQPVPETIKAPPKILEADIGVTTSGNTCPKPSTGRVIIAAEAPRAVFYKVERADGTTTTADWIQGEIKIQNDLMGGKSPWMHAEHALDKLDPGSSKYRLWIDGWGKTPWRTVNVGCPPFEVTSAWLKYDVEDKATCPKKVVETATFHTNRPGVVPYEIKHQGGLVVHSGQVQAKREGDKYIAIAIRHLTMKETFNADMMADVKNSPANSGWVTLKVDCLEAMSGKLTLQSLGATSCKGEALVAIHTNGTGELPYELECGPGKSWQRKVTAMANKIGVDKVQFAVTNNELVTCVLRTRIGGVLKPLDGGSKTFQCHKPTDVDASTNFVPDTRPDPRKPAKPVVAVDPVKPDKQSIVVVDPPRPTISCANGKVKGNACECEPHFKPVKAGKNAWRCVRSTADPKPEKPIVSEPKLTCAGGKVAKGACLCGKGFKPVKVSQDAFRCAKAPAPTRSTGKADSKKTDGKKIDSKPVRSSGGSALTRGVR
jgi:hypothetical protein